MSADGRGRPGAPAGGAVDLRRHMAVPPKMAEEAQRVAEGQLGLRCGGCGRRIGVGFQFTRIEIVRGDDGRPTADVMKLSACNGAEGCEFAAQARAGADVVEMVEHAWLTGEPPVGHDEELGDALARSAPTG